MISITDKVGGELFWSGSDAISSRGTTNFTRLFRSVTRSIKLFKYKQTFRILKNLIDKITPTEKISEFIKLFNLEFNHHQF